MQLSKSTIIAVRFGIVFAALVEHAHKRQQLIGYAIMYSPLCVAAPFAGEGPTKASTSISMSSSVSPGGDAGCREADREGDGDRWGDAAWGKGGRTVLSKRDT